MTAQQLINLFQSLPRGVREEIVMRLGLVTQEELQRDGWNVLAFARASSDEGQTTGWHASLAKAVRAV